MKLERSARTRFYRNRRFLFETILVLPAHYECTQSANERNYREKLSINRKETIARKLYKNIWEIKKNFNNYIIDVSFRRSCSHYLCFHFYISFFKYTKRFLKERGAGYDKHSRYYVRYKVSNNVSRTLEIYYKESDTSKTVKTFKTT